MLNKDPVDIFRKIIITTKIAQQLTVKKNVKCKKWVYGGCSVPNLSYTLIPAADDLASSNRELKRFCPVPGGVELLSICQGTCSAKTLSMRLHNLLLQRKTMRPVHVQTAGFWTDAQQHSFIHLKWRAKNEELDQKHEFKSATWDNYRPTLQCRSAENCKVAVSGHLLCA